MFEEKILCILSDVLEIDISELKSLDKLSLLENNGFTSLKFVQTIVRLEKEFGIEINDSDLIISNFATLNDIYSMLKKYINTSAKKVLVTDCDDVLWRGISGEEDLSIDDISERYQKLLMHLYCLGVIICICSKNEKEDIDMAFETLPMIIKRENILELHTSVIDKAKCISTISNTLNFSVDSFVFIDDSDYELGLVAAKLPEVVTIKFDRNDPSFFSRIQFLFDSSSSGLERTKLYVDQKHREKEKLNFINIDDFNSRLETITKCEIATLNQSERIAELSRRTTQFNLSEAHYTNEEIVRMINDENYRIISLSATDKYGDMGIIGSAILYVGREILIKAFMLSCRAFDRGFENVLISKIKELAGNKQITGIFRKNNRNKKYGNFYFDNGINVI